MQQDRFSEIEITVLDLLREILDDPTRRVYPSDNLVNDLGIDPEVLTFEFAIPLMQQLKIDIPGKAWMNVYTVGDTIELLRRYQGEKPIS